MSVSAQRNGLGISPASFNRITREELRWHSYRLSTPINYQSLVLRPMPWLSVSAKPGDRWWSLFFSKWKSYNRQLEGLGSNGVTHLISPLMRTAPVQTSLFGPVYVVPESLWVHTSLKEMLTGIAYLTMLNENIIHAFILEFGNQFAYGMFQHLWWEQDGAPAHRIIEVTVRLREIFAIVRINQDEQWPARSPDMTPCDFFFIGTRKVKCFQNSTAWYERIKKENM